MKTALPNPTGPVFKLDSDLIAEGLAASRQSPRRRMILPIHRQQDAPVQRMLNFLQPGTYVRPHVHPRSFASETIFVMQGRVVFYIFDESGNITATHDLDHGSLIDIEPHIWHGMACVETDTVVLEIKRGPYDLTEDKTFAKWAPDEKNEAEAAVYLAKLESGFMSQ